MNKFAIIVAGGTGTRMQGDVPKQFMLLKGKPVILHSAEAFHAFDAALSIILVVHSAYVAYCREMLRHLNIAIPLRIVAGGETRFESVRNGLDGIGSDGLVAVHDAARPVIHTDFIAHLFAEAEKYGSAVPGIALNDTIRMLEGEESKQLDRTLLRAMQTPQVYRVSELKDAYTQAFQPQFTDDASVMQSAGFPLHLTEGRSGNIKITHPQDIALAEVLLGI